VLACATLTAIYAATQATATVTVRAGETAVNTYFFKPFAVFSSEISAQIVVKHWFPPSFFLSFYHKSNKKSSIGYNPFRL
jgi:hypothetical protein